MKTTRNYLKTLNTEPEAERWMTMKNQAARDGSIYCLVEGPDNDWVVCDLKTAIATELPYRWSFR